MEAVSGQSSFTSAEALQYLQQTTTALQQDYTNADAELACSGDARRPSTEVTYFWRF
jgi:hypothetical protein